MIVWYSSSANEIISDRAHEEFLDDLMESYNTEDNFETFIDVTYSTSDLFNFTDADRDKARQEFEDWTYERAKDGDMYEPYEVQLARDEEEE